ncbi:MAG: endonuclease domain-containing protein [Actinomycetota bacterium]
MGGRRCHSVPSTGGSAAWLETFEQEVVLEISLPRKTTPAAGVIVHTLDHSWPSDTGICHGFRLTSPARTPLDIGAVIDAERVEFALEGALRRGQVTIPRLTSLLERDAVSVSVPEREYRVELPDGGEAYLDFAYPNLLLGIEVDGYGYHSGRERWRRDMHRENQLKRLGWVILHFSWDDIRYRPEELVNEIKDALVGLTRLL